MIRVKFLPMACEHGFKYRTMNTVTFFSTRYNKKVTVDLGMCSDGATWAPDIDSDCWWFHDVLCNKGVWDDGTRLTNWQCSTVLYDVMRMEGYNYFRCQGWRIATFCGGGGKARDNGLIRLGSK